MVNEANLELHLGDESIRASTNRDGYKVYRAIARLADFIDRVPKPTDEQYVAWFKKTAENVLADFKYEIVESKLFKPHEVIIDARRRLVIHNADKNQDATELNQLLSIHDAFRKLESHNYQFLTYERNLSKGKGSSSSIKRPIYGTDTPTRGLRRPRP